ncbi:glycosyltransferase family 4 protein [Flavobacterium sp.]|uniref:glycosyltransferase family 4 protein n=1 Tax=Flavobacterium sp. TaxID=239 RepID=UPI00261D385A|nr:glycosyltransferase family 4 protein [Flavobacterium sp.]
MKRIILISSEFPPLPGGIGNHAYHLSLGLSENAKEITVVTDQRSPNIKEDIQFDQSLPFQVRRVPRYRFNFWTYWMRIMIVFGLILKEEKPTVIASGKFPLWMTAFLKRFFSKSNCIAILHGSEINAGGSWSKRITKWSLSQFDTLIAVSEFTKQLALQQNNVLNVEVINNGFWIPKNQKEVDVKTISDAVNIVTVGNVTYRKGQQNVIAALPLLKEKFPTIQYHIIGIPTEKNKFEALAKKLNVAENVKFYGALPLDELTAIVAKSQVFFMLSDHLKNGDVEGFGIAVLEANAIGLPAIGSVNSGVADAIQDGFSGKLVHPHDIEGIAAALEAIMLDYETYSEQAKNWSKKFDWSIIIQKYLAILDK